MENKIFSESLTPVKLAAYILAASVLGMLLEFLLRQGHFFSPDPLFAWSVAAALLLLFAIFDSVLSLQADSFTKFWNQSMFSFLGLALGNGMAAWLFSGISIDDAGYYKFIYLVIAIGFLVFLTVVNLMKKIVQFAEKEEWNQPRQRRK